MTLEFRYVLVRLNYVRKLRYNYVSFLFIIVKYILLRHYNVICLFRVVTFFDDVITRLYFGTLELRNTIRIITTTCYE